MRHVGRPTWRIESLRSNSCCQRLNGGMYQVEKIRLTALHEGSQRASSLTIGCGGRDPHSFVRTRISGQTKAWRHSPTSCLRGELSLSTSSKPHRNPSYSFDSRRFIDSSG
ncbi:hypothetical protein RF55_8278 [Lasius niger]|uniref:Uncharacterized protein n=1 Tax=Lasius niger TaxID=67767 RepID=A0A0J7KN52_LASNI|nr:hypothetical protein RF55_8278 [Lasius niger]